MRVYVRTTRGTGISLGPVALIVLGPFLLCLWLVYAAALLVYFGALLLVAAAEAIGDAAERRQRRP